MPLTDAECRRAACPLGRAWIRLTDGKGMYLEITKAGGKYWRFKYRHGGKEKVLALGVYGKSLPEVTLAQARKARDRAREALARGEDPARLKREAIGVLKQMLARPNQRCDVEELVRIRTAELSNALDNAEADSHEKSVLLATVSHELRTLMHSIVGMTTLALRSATDLQQICWLNNGMQAARRFINILNGILDLSSIEAGLPALVEEEFSLAREMDETLNLQREAAQQKGLVISSVIASALLPMQLYGDPLRLRQILHNYVSNAIKFSAYGEIEVQATLLEEASDSVVLRLAVTDQGVGVSMEQQDRLFRSRIQVEDTNSGKFTGAGFGLAIVGRLAKLMGGDAGVVSEVGVGSTFWVTVCVKKVAPKKGDVSQHGALALTRQTALEIILQQFAGARVLVAEDDPVNQEIFGILLSKAGLVSEMASDGQQTLRHARDGGFSLIMMDMNMPVMDGLEATRAIRQLPGGTAIPILATTASALDEDRQRCLEAGMSGYISNPVDPDVLYPVLLHWLLISSPVSIF